MKNAFDGLITRLNRAERTLNFKISQQKLSKLQHVKKKNIIQDFKHWNNISLTYMQLNSKKEERENLAEAIYRKETAVKFLKVKKDIK